MPGKKGFGDTRKKSSQSPAYKKQKFGEPKSPFTKKRSPAKQGLILDKRTKEQKAKDQKSKELWDKTVNIDDVPGVGGEKSKMQKQMEGRKTDMKKKKSPAKLAPLIAMAGKAILGKIAFS